MFNLLKDREQQILQLLYERNICQVSMLCSELGVSSVTLRSDIDRLEEMGYLIKGHGSCQAAYSRVAYDRMNSMSKEKLAIAKVASDMIVSGDRFMVIAGTTTSLIQRFLYTKSGINVVTNSTTFFSHARTNKNVKVILSGGEYLCEAEAMVGSMALRALDQFHVKTSFIGADGISLENGISSFNLELAEVAKKMIERSERTILLADSSKFNHSGFYHICELGSIDTIITDSGFDKNLHSSYNKKGIKIVIAQ